MEHIGIDVHKNESQICRLTDDGEIIEKRVATRHDRFAAVLGSLPRARILIEASTESEWIARCLDQLGHEVIVADPNFGPMYASRTRRVKTDKRDAQALMDACRLGADRRSHRVSETQRRVRTLLAVRDHLVRTRARQVQLLRALLRREGLRPRAWAVANFARRLDEVTPPRWLQVLITPVRTVMETLNQKLAQVDQMLVKIVRHDPVVQRLCTAPGIGPVTAVAFVSTLDDVQRFEGAHKVRAYIGLVPSEFSAGERQQRGAITKTGNTRLRWLLIEAAWSFILALEHERRQLRVARLLSHAYGVTVPATFLGAHALPPEYSGHSDAYIDEVCREMPPALAAEGLVDAVDVYCERIGFSLQQTEAVFRAGQALGLPVKLHAEQLSAMNGAALAARFNALSCDHLEHLSEEGIAAMRAAGTVAVLLPAAYYTLRDIHPPPVERLRAAGVPMAVATDHNPGTSPMLSLLLATNMACTLFGLTVAEAIDGVTKHAARALGLHASHGVIGVGRPANFVLWNVDRIEQLPYECGRRHPCTVVRQGRLALDGLHVADFTEAAA